MDSSNSCKWDERLCACVAAAMGLPLVALAWWAVAGALRAGYPYPARYAQYMSLYVAAVVGLPGLLLGLWWRWLERRRSGDAAYCALTVFLALYVIGFLVQWFIVPKNLLVGLFLRW